MDETNINYRFERFGDAILSGAGWCRMGVLGRFYLYVTANEVFTKKGVL